MPEDIELVGLYEVAKIAKVHPSAVCNWRKRHSDFPKPIANLRMGPIFRKKEVIVWLTLSKKISIEKAIKA